MPRKNFGRVTVSVSKSTCCGSLLPSASVVRFSAAALPALWWFAGGGKLQAGAGHRPWPESAVKVLMVRPSQAPPPLRRSLDDYSCSRSCSPSPPPPPLLLHAAGAAAAPSSLCPPHLTRRRRWSCCSHLCRTDTSRSQNPRWIAASFHWGGDLGCQGNPLLNPSAGALCRNYLRLGRFFSPGWWGCGAALTSVSRLNLAPTLRACCQA